MAKKVPIGRNPKDSILVILLGTTNGARKGKEARKKDKARTRKVALTNNLKLLSINSSNRIAFAAQVKVK